MNDAIEHCVVTGPLPGQPSALLTLHGDTFDICLREYREGESSEGGINGLGEEVATILSGEFAVDAAGEQYTLTPGEGIIIPRDERRRWTCASGHGVLYRAIVRNGAAEQVTP